MKKKVNKYSAVNPRKESARRIPETQKPWRHLSFLPSDATKTSANQTPLPSPSHVAADTSCQASLSLTHYASLPHGHCAPTGRSARIGNCSASSTAPRPPRHSRSAVARPDSAACCMLSSAKTHCGRTRPHVVLSPLSQCRVSVSSNSTSLESVRCGEVSDFDVRRWCAAALGLGDSAGRLPGCFLAVRCWSVRRRTAVAQLYAGHWSHC